MQLSFIVIQKVIEISKTLCLRLKQAPIAFSLTPFIADFRIILFPVKRLLLNLSTD